MTTSKWAPKYLEKIKATRGPRKPGEIFILKWKDLGYFFGRVVTDRVAMSPTPDSPPRGPWPHRDGNYLVYIYADPHPAPNPVPRLDRDRLIIPPVVVLNSPWTSGFFAPVAHQPLTSRDVLRRHCFWFVEDTDHLIDEMGNRLARRTEPCRQQALHNHGSIENEMCDVLGLPRRIDGPSRRT